MMKHHTNRFPHFINLPDFVIHFLVIYYGKIINEILTKSNILLVKLCIAEHNQNIYIHYRLFKDILRFY